MWWKGVEEMGPPSRPPNLSRSSSHSGPHSNRNGDPSRHGQQCSESRKGSLGPGRPPQRPGATRQGAVRGERERSLSRLAKVGMAAVGTADSQKPVKSSSAMALDKAEEVMCIGQWSVRKFKDPEHGLVYVDTTTGHTRTDPPKEVLFALEIDHDGQEVTEGAEEVVAIQETSSPAVNETPTSPRFRRIVLGSRHDVPLKMARDLLEAVREDITIFEQLQKRFSEFPSEPIFPSARLSEAVENAARELNPGEISDVISTDAGMQILLRVS